MQRAGAGAGADPARRTRLRMHAEERGAKRRSGRPPPCRARLTSAPPRFVHRHFGPHIIRCDALCRQKHSVHRVWGFPAINARLRGCLQRNVRRTRQGSSIAATRWADGTLGARPWRGAGWALACVAGARAARRGSVHALHSGLLRPSHPTLQRKHALAAAPHRRSPRAAPCCRARARAERRCRRATPLARPPSC